MTFLVISRAETLHTLRYKPGKHFWNLVGGYFLLISGPFLRKKIGKKFGNSPLQRYPKWPLLIRLREGADTEPTHCKSRTHYQ